MQLKECAAAPRQGIGEIKGQVRTQKEYHVGWKARYVENERLACGRMGWSCIY